MRRFRAVIAESFAVFALKADGGRTGSWMIGHQSNLSSVIMPAAFFSKRGMRQHPQHGRIGARETGLSATILGLQSHPFSRAPRARGRDFPKLMRAAAVSAPACNHEGKNRCPVSGVPRDRKRRQSRSEDLLSKVRPEQCIPQPFGRGIHLCPRNWREMTSQAMPGLRR
jgi:hypothetical protein